MHATDDALPARSAPRHLTLVLASLAAGAAHAQDMLEIGGRVRDIDGRPVAGARVEFAPLALRALARNHSRYHLAQSRHRAAVHLPRTATDREGRWRVLLSPEQAALALGGTAELEMRVQAPGFASWHRAIGPDLMAAGEQQVRLEPPGPGLRLRLTGGKQPPRGFVLVERPFRVRGNTAVWRRELLPIDERGEVRFAEPPRVPGEIGAAHPTARAEGYALTIYAAGMEETSAVLGTGTHELRLEPNEFSWRDVLADRAEPARPPVEATYRLLGEEHTLTFADAAVPLLGEQMPIRITTASGPVEIDSWDPDLPMFVRRPSRAGGADGAGAQAAEAAPAEAAGTAALCIVDAQQRPVFGAGVWLENEAVENARADAQVFALTDAAGEAVLRGVPLGSHRVLARHPAAGACEADVTFAAAAAAPQQMALQPTAARPDAPPPLEGTLLLELSALQHADASLEVGMLTAERLLVRRRFDEVPRWLRLEGLVVGPTTFYLQRDGDRPLVFGGVLAQPHATPRAIGPPSPRRFALRVLDARGEPVRDVRVSLGESGMGEQPPPSAALLDARPGPRPGEIALELTLIGTAWLRVEAPGCTPADVQITPSADTTEVRLDPLPPPAPPPPPHAPNLPPPDRKGGD